MMDISVIIPTYNREKSISRAIESVLCQSVPVSEVIVVDDHSADNTSKVIEQINDQRVKYIYLESNHGAGYARNRGVEISSCEWIAFHDSDDVWDETKIEKQIQYICLNKVDFVYSSYMTENGLLVPQCFKVSCYSGNILKSLLIHNTIGAPTILMKKTLFDCVGGFDEDMRSLEDWDFALKVAQKCEIGYIEEPLLKVYNIDEGLSSRFDEHLMMMCYILGKHKKIFLDNNMFDDMILDIMTRAKKYNVSDMIEKLLTYYLTL